MAMNDDRSAVERLEQQLAKPAQSQNITARPPSLREMTAHRLEEAKAEVKRLEELAELLEANPSTSRILELMGNGGRSPSNY